METKELQQGFSVPNIDQTDSKEHQSIEKKVASSVKSRAFRSQLVTEVFGVGKGKWKVETAGSQHCHGPGCLESAAACSVFVSDIATVY